MDSLEYGKMPSFDGFVKHLRSYKDLDGLVAGEPPEVFVMEVHPSCDDYEAFFDVYQSINSSVQDDIDTVISSNDDDWIKVTFTSYKSFYDFLLAAIEKCENSMELAAMILETIGYNWI